MHCLKKVWKSVDHIEYKISNERQNPLKAELCSQSIQFMLHFLTKHHILNPHPISQNDSLLIYKAISTHCLLDSQQTGT